MAVQASLVRTRDFEWIIGGNIARNESEVKSLGNTSQLINSYSDGAQLVSRVGESPYQFYGYQTLGYSLHRLKQMLLIWSIKKDRLIRQETSIL